MPPLASNRSMPDSAVIPVLHYPEVPQAVAWLCRAFGLSERLRIGTHRVQLQVAAGMGALVVAQGPSPGTRGTSAGVALMVRIADADAHHAAAQAAGAEIMQLPSSYPYGERQSGVAISKPLYQDDSLVSYRCADPDGYLIEVFWEAERAR